MDFSSMSGWDFERYCADCLLKKGFTKAEVTSGSGDHGVDIIAEQNGIRFGIQCKLYQGQIPNKTVQEAYTGASYYDCDVAVIMSNSELTKQAQEEARKLRVKFWRIVDYIPEENGNEDSELKTKTYEDYCYGEKEREEQLEKKIQEELGESEKNTLAVSNPYQCALENKYFRKSNSWLDHDNVIKSIEYFCIELEETVDISNEELLFLKLSYVKHLCKALSDERDIMDYISNYLCLEIDQQLRLSAKGEMTISQEEFNEKYWMARYSYEQLRHITEKIACIIDCFTKKDFAEIEKLKKNNNSIKNNDHKKSLLVLKDQITILLGEWWQLSFYEERTFQSWRFWENRNAILDEIRSHKQLIKNTEEHITNSIALAQKELSTEGATKLYLEKLNKKRQLFAILLQKLLIQKTNEKVIEERKKHEEAQIYAERQMLGTLLHELWVSKAQQEVIEAKIEQRKLERKKREIEIEKAKAAQRAEQERLVKEKQEAERRALVQSLIDHYNTECSEIDLEATARRKELESRAQNEIAQAQKQIGEFLKQKEAFTLFRKKRDAELEGKIRILTSRISQLKESLSYELEEYEKEIQTERGKLLEEVLSTADKEGVLEEVKAQL